MCTLYIMIRKILKELEKKQDEQLKSKHTCSSVKVSQQGTYTIACSCTRKLFVGA